MIVRHININKISNNYRGILMADIKELVDELFNKLTSSNPDIVECLKKSLIIAEYFNDQQVLDWIRKVESN